MRATGATFVDTESPLAFVTALQTARDDVAIGEALKAKVAEALTKSEVNTPDSKLAGLAGTLRKSIRAIFLGFAALQEATKADPREAIVARSRAMTCHGLLAMVVPMELAAFLAAKLADKDKGVQGDTAGAFGIWINVVTETLKDIVCQCAHVKADALSILEAGATDGWTVPADHKTAFGVGPHCSMCKRRPCGRRESWMPHNTIKLERFMNMAAAVPVTVTVRGRQMQMPLYRAVHDSIDSQAQTMRLADGVVPTSVSGADRDATIADVVYLLSAVGAMCIECVDAYSPHCKTTSGHQAFVSTGMMSLGAVWPAVRAAWTLDGTSPGMPFTAADGTAGSKLARRVMRAVQRVAQVAMATTIIVDVLGRDCGRRAHCLAAFNVVLLALDVASAQLNFHTNKPPRQDRQLVLGPLSGPCPGMVTGDTDALILPSVLPLAAQDIPVVVPRDAAVGSSVLSAMMSPMPLNASTAVQVVAAGYGGSFVKTVVAEWTSDLAMLCPAAAGPPPPPVVPPPPPPPPVVDDEDADGLVPLDSSDWDSDNDIVLGD